MLNYLLPVLSALLMAITLLILKLVSLELPYIPFSFWRVLFSSFSFFIFFNVDWKKEFYITRSKKLFLLLIAKGFLGFFLYKILNLIALAHTTAINVSIFKAMVPILTVFLSALFFKDRVTKQQAIAFVFSFLGVVLILTQGQLESFDVADLYGESIALLATFVWVFHGLIVQKIGKQLSSAFIACTSALIGVACFACMGSPQELVYFLYNLNGIQWLMLIYLSVVASMFGSWLFVHCIQDLGAGITTLIKFSLLPVFMMVLSMLFLGVVPDIWQLLGAATVMVSLFIGLYRKKAKPIVTADPEEVLRAEKIKNN